MVTRISDAFGIEPIWFDTPYAFTDENLANGLALPPVEIFWKKSNIRAIDPDDAEDAEIIYVPESRIEFACGNGRTAIYELVEDSEPATYRRSWFQKHGLKPDRVRRFRVAGDSQEPFLFDGDTVLVNLDETNIIDSKLYAIRYGDDLRIKFLFRKLDGSLILRSTNPSYPDEEVSADLANEHIAVIGRVRDISGTGGL